MRSTGVEDLKAALRRSIRLLVVLPIIGAVAMTAVKQVQEPQYRATARVLLPQSDLAATLAGIQPPYVDPVQRDDAESNLANARALYVRAADETGGSLGSGGFLRDVTEADAQNNVVEFATTTADRAQAIGVANAVASVYPDWRAETYGRTIEAAIDQIRAQLRSGSGGGALAEQLQRLNVLKTLNSGNTAIVEPAEGAAQTTPRLIRDAVLGGLIGFVLALLIAGLRELLDTRVRTEADIEDSIGVPVLATVQTIPKRSRSRAVMADPRFADSYELLAANLAQILEDEERPTYVAVTSADPGEGKTTTSANLALALARRGQDVVLADFDLRKPTLGPLFSVPEDAAGVADVLRRDVAVSTTLWPISLGAVGTTRARIPGAIRRGTRGSVRVAPSRTDAEGTLLLLPAGRAGQGGTAGSFSRLPKLLESLDNIAEFVIIDTPPALLTAGVAELAQTVSAVLVVVRQGTATRRRLRALGSRGQTWRARIVGAVLNGAAGDERYSSYYGSE
jgi:Mrp family chromosome partitioning ATPase